MRGLIWKDLYCIRGYLKQLGIMLIFMLGMGIVFRNTELVTFMLIFMSMSLVQTCMLIDEKNKWERYALTMPVGRREMVRSKYLLMLLMGAGATLLAILVNGISSMVGGIAPIETVFSAVAVLVVYLYIFSISIPLCFKLGADKARYMMMLVVVIPAVAIAIVDNLFPSLLENLTLTPHRVFAIGVGALIVGVVLFVCSYRVSLGIYERKEF